MLKSIKRTIYFNKFTKRMNSSYMKVEYSNQDIILTPNEGYNTLLVWMHGLGDSAQGYLEIFNSSYRPTPEKMKIILLTAPKAPVSLNNGYVMTSWYDIADLGNGKFKMGADEMVKNSLRVRKIIENEVKKLNGDYSKVFLGGFSQGAVMTLNIGLSANYSLGGLIALSGHLAEETEINDERSKVPVLLCHGTFDDLITESRAKQSYQQLFDKGFNCVYKTYDIDHTISLEEFDEMKSFITKLV